MDELLANFKHDDYPPGQPRKVAKQCAELAAAMARMPVSGELVAGLRKLLEARDCLVRAAAQVEEAKG